MTATYYTVSTTGTKKAYHTTPVTSKDWLATIIRAWECDGWYTKDDGDGTVGFYRGLNEGSYLIVIGG